MGKLDKNAPINDLASMGLVKKLKRKAEDEAEPCSKKAKVEGVAALEPSLKQNGA